MEGRSARRGERYAMNVCLRSTAHQIPISRKGAIEGGRFEQLVAEALDSFKITIFQKPIEMVYCSKREMLRKIGEGK